MFVHVLAFGMPGGWEWVIIFFAILLLFGAKRIPALARSLGRSIREFKDGAKEVQQELEDTANRQDKENAPPPPTTTPPK